MTHAQETGQEFNRCRELGKECPSTANGELPVPGSQGEVSDRFGDARIRVFRLDKLRPFGLQPSVGGIIRVTLQRREAVAYDSQIHPERGEGLQQEDFSRRTQERRADFDVDDETPHLQDWIDLVRSREKPNTPAEEGVRCRPSWELGISNGPSGSNSEPRARLIRGVGDSAFDPMISFRPPSESPSALPRLAFVAASRISR